MKLELSRNVFEKVSYTKFQQNPSGGSRVVPCGRTEGRTDVTKLTVAFCNFAKAPKNKTGGKVVSPMHRPSLPPGRAPGTHFC